METNLRFGMLHTTYNGREETEQIEEKVVNEDGETEIVVKQVSHFFPTVCKDDKCGRLVQHNDLCFVDTWTEQGLVYCDACGKCMRYERKMADRRGELERKF